MNDCTNFIRLVYIFLRNKAYEISESVSSMLNHFKISSRKLGLASNKA